MLYYFKIPPQYSEMGLTKNTTWTSLTLGQKFILQYSEWNEQMMMMMNTLERRGTGL